MRDLEFRFPCYLHEKLIARKFQVQINPSIEEYIPCVAVEKQRNRHGACDSYGLNSPALRGSMRKVLWNGGLGLISIHETGMGLRR